MKKLLSMLMAAVMLLTFPAAEINVKADDAGSVKSFKEVSLAIVYGETADLSTVLDDEFKNKGLSATNCGNIVKLNGRKIHATGVGNKTITVTANTDMGVLKQKVKVSVKPKKVTKLIAKRSAANNLDYDCIILQWDKQVNASYKIYRSAKKRGRYKCIGTLKNSYFKGVKYPKVQWLNKKVTHGKKYYYKVKAYSKNIKGDCSNVCTVKKWRKTKRYADYITLSVVNKIRVKRKLRPYLWDFRANKGAKQRVKELTTCFSHKTPGGKDALAKAFTYYKKKKRILGSDCVVRKAVSENISLGYSGVYAINAYMTSPGHKEWIIDDTTQDMEADGTTIMPSGKIWNNKDNIPGNVCGMSCWTYINGDTAYNCFVFTKMKNYREGQKIPDGC